MTPLSSPDTFTICVSGSRSLTDERRVRNAFVDANERADDLVPRAQRWVWVHGGAEGVDSIVAEYVDRNYIPEHEPRTSIECIRPDYKTYGRQAPFVRNQELVDRADLLIAVWDGISGGTRDTIEKAARKGIPIVIEVLRP